MKLDTFMKRVHEIKKAGTGPLWPQLEETFTKLEIMNCIAKAVNKGYISPFDSGHVKDLTVYGNKNFILTYKGEYYVEALQEAAQPVK